MPADQVAEFFHSVVALVDFLPEAVEHLFGLVVEKLDQNVVLVLEVEIDGAVGNTGLARDLGDGGLEKSLLGKYLDGRLKDALIFVVGLSLLIDGTPPVDAPAPSYDMGTKCL